MAGFSGFTNNLVPQRLLRYKPRPNHDSDRTDMEIPLQSPALVSRPARQLFTLWALISLYVALKGSSTPESKAVVWGIVGLACQFIIVWRLGRREPIRRWYEILLGETSTLAVDNRARRWNWMYAMLGFAFVAIALACLEWRQSFFFSQDDNLAQFMPVMLDGCRSLLNHGIFSTWNPHQFLGSPTSSLGVYALTYPPTYGSYAIAKWLLQDEYAMLEVFCITHLLVGYATTYWAARQLGIRSSLAATVGTCFAVSGFFLIAGRSWYYMTPTATWMPIVVGLLARLPGRTVGWKWVLAMGFALAALFHAGNAQMWCYALVMMCACLAIWLWCRTISWSQMVPAISSLLLGIALAMPLLIPQYHETTGLRRVAGDGVLVPYLGSLFLPYPLAKADHPGMNETPNFDHMGQLYYAGTVFSVVAALGMLAMLAMHWNRRLVAANVWLPLAWVALLFALGRIGGLWYLLAKFPPFSGFEHPFKFIPFVSLFMLLGGALLLERLLRHSKRRHWEWAVCTVAVLCMGYHVWLSIPSFCDYGFRPYPNLPAELQAIRDDPRQGRILAIGPRRNLAPEYGLSLMHQMPTVWGLDALAGYDPLVGRSPRFSAVVDKLYAPLTNAGTQLELGSVEMGLPAPTSEIESQSQFKQALHSAPTDDESLRAHSARTDASCGLTTLRTYGVRWVMVYCGPNQPHVGAEGNNHYWKLEPTDEQLVAAVKETGRLVVHRPEFCIYELADPTPLAFMNDRSETPLPIHSSSRGMTIDTANLPSGGDVVVNVLANPYLKPYADSQSIPIAVDAWGRIVVHLPPTARQLSFVYRPPWLAGALCGAFLAACAAALMHWRRRFEAALARLESYDQLVNLTFLRRAA